MRKIYTHKPPHHIDEVVAISVIKSFFKEEKFEIIEVDKVDFDSVDKSAYVVDIGRKYDPEKGYFDHHQIDNASVSSLTQVVDHFIPELREDDDFEWFVRTKTVADNKGPNLLLWNISREEELYEFYKNQFNALFMIERAVVGMDINKSTDLLVEILIEPTLEKMKLEKEMVDSGDISLKGVENVLIVEYSGLALDRDLIRIRNSVTDKLKRAQPREHNFSVYRSTRDPEDMIEIRREGKCSLDLNVLKEEFGDDIHFVHNSGFLAVAKYEFGSEGMDRVVEWLGQFK